MMKKEGPNEVYERARTNLAKSLMDGIDIKNAAADFYFSLLNLQRHGVMRSWHPEDWTLQKMSDIILKEGPSPSDQWSLAPTLGEGGGWEAIRETEGSLSNHPWKGRVAPFHPPVKWENDNQIAGAEQKTGLMHGAWPKLRHLKPGEETHYATEFPFDSDHHPLLQGHDFGLPQFVEQLASFYLRPDPHTPSLAEKIAEKERKWETAHANHAITQPVHKTEIGRYKKRAKARAEEKEEQEETEEPTDYDSIFADIEHPDKGWWKDSPKQREEDRDESRHPFFGPLMGMGEGPHGVHQNDTYNHHFNNWIKGNPEALDNAPGSSQEEKMWHAKRAHFDHMAQQWISGENHIDDDGAEHSSKLGWLGYMLGLEFLEPQERTAVVEHMMNNGTDYDQHGTHIPMGRIKRNFHQRVLPEYLWWYRHPQMHGPNMNQFPEKSHLEHGEYSEKDLYRAAMEHNLEGSTDTPHDIMLDHFNQMMGLEGSAAHTLLPKILRSGKVSPTKQNLSDTPKLSYNTLRLLAGFDEDGNEYPPGEHPIFGSQWDGSLIGQKDYHAMLQHAKEATERSLEEHGIRNAAIPHRAAHGPSKKDIEDHDLGDWYLTDTDGPHSETFASHWHKPFNKGGMNRSPMGYLEILHDFLTLAHTDDKNAESRAMRSHSLFGTGAHDFRDGEKHSLTLRDDMLGLLGSILPPIARPPHIAPSPHESSEEAKSRKRMMSLPKERNLGEILNLWEQAGAVFGENFRPKFAPRQAKHNVTLTTSTNHSPFVHEAMRLSHDERKKELGTTMNWEMDGRNTHTYSPFVRMETPYSGHINPQTGGAGSYRLATILGRMHPPASPMQNDILNFNDIMSGKVQPEHLPFGDVNLWAEHQGLLQRKPLGQGVLTSDTMPILQAMKDLGRRANATTIAEHLELIPPEPDVHDVEAHEAWREERDHTIRSVKNTMESVPEHIPTPEEDAMLGRADTIITELLHLEEGINHAISSGDEAKVKELTDEYRGMEEYLKEMETALSKIPTRNIERIHGRAEWPWDKHNEMAKSHMTAITNVAKDLRKKMEKEHPDLYPEDDPQRLLSNALQTFRFANRYLMEMPHEHHGQYGHGYGGVEIKEKKAEELLGENPFSKIVQGMKGLSKRAINPNHSVDEVMELLQLDPNNPIHKKNAQALLDSLDGKEKIPLKISELHSSGLIPRVDPIDADLDELADQGDATVQAGLRQAHQLFNLKGAEAATHGLSWVQSEPHGQRREMPRTGGSGRATVKTHNNRLDGLDRLNSFLLLDPEMQPESEEMPSIRRSKWSNFPINNVGPNGHTALDLLEGDRLNWGWGMAPDFMPRFRSDGSVQVHRSNVPVPTRLHSVPSDYLLAAFPEMADHIGSDLHLAEPNMMSTTQYGSSPMDDPNIITASEDNISLLSLTNPDTLLMKGDSNDWSPPIRPMHRIFQKDDLEALKGFSGGWVVSKINTGERLVIKKKGGRITAFDENGERKSLESGMAGSFKNISDEDYIIDGILSKEGQHFQVLDITKHQESDVSDLLTHERVKLLRAHYSSNENVEMPAPHNTRTTDEEGLNKALENLKDEDKDVYLLRDSQSTYMKGERRHPKWVLLRSPQEVNLIVLDRRGKGPFSYRLGAGPLLDNEGLGNRAKSVDDKPYMDIGTVVRSDKTFNVGDIVNVGVDSVSQSSRKGRDVFTIQAQDVIGEGYGEGPASLETLSLLTKSHPPILWPHQITMVDNDIHINLISIEDEVIYKSNEWPEGWQIHSPMALMGDMTDSDYAIRLSESLRPFWAPIAGAMLKGMDCGLEEEKKEEVHESEEDAEPLIEPKKIKDTFQKPGDDEETIKRALNVAIRALDILNKERTTSTGARGMGVDFGTPVESPRGPTRLVNESAVPDWDMRPRPSTDPEKPWEKKAKENGKTQDGVHEVLETDSGEEAELDIDEDSATLSI